ncbi:MAG: hypothetical protein ABI072_05795, partial [Edaphobacter sp.]
LTFPNLTSTGMREGCTLKLYHFKNAHNKLFIIRFESPTPEMMKEIVLFRDPFVLDVLGLNLPILCSGGE